MPKRRVQRHSVTQPCDPSYRLIPLTKGQNAIVDAADFTRLSQWNWFARWCEYTQSFYAERRLPHYGSIISMNAFILGCSSGEKSDHKNHDTLDNRRQNLRKATCSQNQWNRRKASHNTSGYKGVHWAVHASKWRAVISFRHIHKHLGYFLSSEAAAHAYDEAAKIYHGEFAFLNFP